MIQLREALQWRKENQAGQIDRLRSISAERDAALARLAELEGQEPITRESDDECLRLEWLLTEPYQAGHGKEQVLYQRVGADLKL